MSTVLKFQQDSVTRQEGERARIRVVQGPDAGVTFVLRSKKTVIGRGEDCDVLFSDASMSRRHAEILYLKTGWKVVDLGSANGIIHNGVGCRDAELKLNDRIELGETLFEFIPSTEVDVQLLLAAPKSALQIQSEQKAFNEQKERVRALGSSGPKRAARKKQGLPKPLMLVGALGAIAFVFMQDSGKNPGSKKQPVAKAEAKGPARDTAGMLIVSKAPALSPEFEKSVDSFYHAGFREYRAGNYMRAKQQFELALQIDPQHQLARMYLGNVISQVKSDIELLMERGRRSLSAGKLKDAKTNYEAVLRLLSRDSDHPKFKEAKQRVEEIEKQLKGKG